MIPTKRRRRFGDQNAAKMLFDFFDLLWIQLLDGNRQSVTEMDRFACCLQYFKTVKRLVCMRASVSTCMRVVAVMITPTRSTKKTEHPSFAFARRSWRDVWGEGDEGRPPSIPHTTLASNYVKRLEYYHSASIGRCCARRIDAWRGKHWKMHLMAGYSVYLWWKETEKRTGKRATAGDRKMTHLSKPWIWKVSATCHMIGKLKRKQMAARSIGENSRSDLRRRDVWRKSVRRRSVSGIIDGNKHYLGIRSFRKCINVNAFSCITRATHVDCVVVWSR